MWVFGSGKRGKSSAPPSCSVGNKVAPSYLKWYVLHRKQTVYHLPRTGIGRHLREHHSPSERSWEHLVVFAQGSDGQASFVGCLRRVAGGLSKGCGRPIEGLREAYKEKITRRYGNPYNYCNEQKRKQNALNALLEVPPEEARAIKFAPSEGVSWMDDIKQSCTHTLCGYVRAYLRLKDKALRSFFGYETHEEAVGALLHMACEQRDEVPVTFSGLRKRVKVYEEHGVQGLSPKNLQNKNALKVQAGLPQDLMDYLNSHPNNIDVEKAQAIYNLAIQKVGGKEVTARTVRNWRASMTPGVRALGTRGVRELSNHHLIQHKRRRPSLPTASLVPGWLER